MPIDGRTPVIVGVGQVNSPGADAPEPVDLLADAARSAFADSGAMGLVAALDSIRVVRLLSWRYADPGALVAERIGATPRHTAVTTDGGHTPQALVNAAAAEILAGRHDVVLIGGAESWRARMTYRRRGQQPPWTRSVPGEVPAEVIGQDLAMSNDIETTLDVIRPVQVYPLFESALRHAAGRSNPEHTAHIAELWARFSAVAADNPHAAVRRAVTADEIATPSASNRMIGFPYTKLLNSNNSVNQAAAIVLCSLDRATAAGVPRDRIVFPLVGSEANDTAYVSNRTDLSSSPAIRVAGRALLATAKLSIDEIAHIDVYSCFPSAVQIAAAELAVGIDRQLTVTGGLTFAGGPWNNYVSHSIATMVDVLRRDPGSVGLCSANGGLLTKHALGLFGTEPPATPFRVERPALGTEEQPRELAPPDTTGAATIEAYTVMHDAHGEPDEAIIVALLPDGRRAWQTTREPELMRALIEQEMCAQPISLRPMSPTPSSHDLPGLVGT